LPISKLDKQISRRVSALLDELDIAWNPFADQIGIPRKSFSRLLRGNAHWRISQLKAVCDGLKKHKGVELNISNLLEYKEDKEESPRDLLRAAAYKVLLTDFIRENDNLRSKLQTLLEISRFCVPPDDMKERRKNCPKVRELIERLQEYPS